MDCFPCGKQSISANCNLAPLRKQGYKLAEIDSDYKSMQNLGKKSKSMVDPCLKLFGKEDAAYYFLRSCSCLSSQDSYTDEE